MKARRKLETNPRRLLPAPKEGLFDNLKDTGGFSHSKIIGGSIMEVPSRYGRGFRMAPGDIEGAIAHFENKERIHRLLQKRLGPEFKDVRIMPTTFVTQYETRDGKKVPWGTEVPRSGRADQMIYRHKQLYHPVAPSLSEAKTKWQKEKCREVLDDIFHTMGTLHNKARIAHGDLHGDNIRMYRDLPHFEDFGKGVDLKRATKKEVIEGMGEDLVRATKEFKDHLPKEEVGARIEAHIDRLKFPTEIKEGVRKYLNEHPWDADYVSFRDLFHDL